MNKVRIERMGKKNIEVKGDRIHVNGKRVPDGRKHYIHVKVFGKEIYNQREKDIKREGNEEW